MAKLQFNSLDHIEMDEWVKFVFESTGLWFRWDLSLTLVFQFYFNGTQI